MTTEPERRGQWGVAAALLSSSLGGTAVGATRYLAGVLDPVTIGAGRFVGGFLILAPLAALLGARLPPRRDWPGVAGLGLLFFGVFPVLFNAALAFTTAARGALALATLPLLTLAAGSVLGIEAPTARKSFGVSVALAGVCLALGTSLAQAPAGAWRGDLLMVGAAATMALYTVWSRPFISRCGALSFAACGMGIGALCLGVVSAWRSGLDQFAALSAMQWAALAYLGVICGALIFFLWAFALGRAAPTLVAVSVAVNPVTAALFGTWLLDEPIRGSLLGGLAAVVAGIAIAAGGSPSSQ